MQVYTFDLVALQCWHVKKVPPQSTNLNESLVKVPF